MTGHHVRIAPFDAARHAEALWDSFGGPAINRRIRYFGWPDLGDAVALARHIEGFASGRGWSTGVIVVGERPVGMASYMREDAANGVVEIGAIAHSEALARSPAATEAHHLLMGHAFALGYRRYEWKCDDANEASKRAALRLGFRYEGTFRQHLVKRGRNRDTAWFSVLDGEWPRLDAAFQAWLAPANFDAAGMQGRSLAAMRDRA